MPKHVAFLRAINVGGRFVKMDALRDHFRELGLTNVETFIASGNVIFETRAKDLAALEKKIEAQLLKKLGYDVDVFLRTEDEVAAIAAAKPFTAARVKAADAFCVGLLKKPLEAAALEALAALRTPEDDFRPLGREAYWLCTVQQSKSKFSNAVFERRLRVRATWRDLNTMTRLVARIKPSA